MILQDKEKMLEITTCVNCDEKPLVFFSKRENAYMLEHKQDSLCVGEFKWTIIRNSISDCIAEWNFRNVPKYF